MGTAVALRVVLALVAWRSHGTTAFLAVDSATYLAPAMSIATHGAFENANGQAELFRTPGYPLLLAFGLIAGHPLLVPLATQVLLSALLVALTYALARELFDERAARLCAWIAAIEPTMLLWSVKLMPETLFTCALVAFVYAAIRALATRDARWTLASALALCAAIYVKPIAYPLAFVVVLAALFVTARHALVFLAMCMLLLAPWHVRNYARARYAGFTTLMDHAVYLSAGGSVAARQQHESFVAMRQRMLADAARIDGPARYATMRRDGLALVRTDPFGYARTHVAGMLRTLFDPGAVEYARLFGAYPENGGALAGIVDRGLARGALAFARARPALFAAALALALLLAPLVLLPLLGIARDRRVPLVFVALVVAYLVVASGGVPGSSRFRAPMVPLLALLSGAALRDRVTLQN